MSKSITTRWYIGAWVVWAICWVVVFLTGHTGSTGHFYYVQGTNPLGAIALLVVWLMALVMLVMWVGALIRLGQQRSWGWFAGVLILHLIGLGIVGMGAYAIAGPADGGMEVRPTAT